MALLKKLSSRCKRLCHVAEATGRLRTGAGFKHCAQLPYLTVECCAPVWCRSAHTRFIDSVLNDALRIITGCLLLTPINYFPILSGIQTAELRRLGSTLSLAYRKSLEPDHTLYGLLSGFTDACQERLRSRRPFVPAAGNLLNNLAGLGIFSMKYQECAWEIFLVGAKFF